MIVECRPLATSVSNRLQPDPSFNREMVAPLSDTILIHAEIGERKRRAVALFLFDSMRERRKGLSWTHLSVGRLCISARLAIECTLARLDFPSKETTVDTERHGQPRLMMWSNCCWTNRESTCLDILIVAASSSTLTLSLTFLTPRKEISLSRSSPLFPRLHAARDILGELIGPRERLDTQKNLRIDN